MTNHRQTLAPSRASSRICSSNNFAAPSSSRALRSLHNRILASFSACTLGLASLCCLGGTASVFAQDSEGGGGGATVQTEKLPDLAPIKRELEQIRGLQFLANVPAQRQSTEDFKAHLLREMEASMPADRFADIIDGLIRFGLTSERFDLADGFINAILTQAAAYYDPETGKFFYLMEIDGEEGEEMMATVAAHELVHALQDQHYNLKRVVEELEKAAMPDSGPRRDDYVLAVRALIEGEATYVQLIWQLKTMMGQDITTNHAMERMAIGQIANMDLDQLGRMMQMQAGAMPESMRAAINSMNDIPRYVLEPLYAAYFRGASFTMRLRQAGGWEKVAETYQRLPRSMEQVLHPEKFLDQVDEPTVIVLPDFLYLEEAGWSKIDEAVHGEFYLRMMLREQGLDRRAAETAAAGWDGDIYRAYRHIDGRVLMALATTWDTEADAREFAAAYARTLAKKLNVTFDGDTFDDESNRFEYDFADSFAVPKQPAGDGAESAEPAISGGAAVNADGAQTPKPRSMGTVLLRGKEVFVVEGAPDRGLTNRLLASLTGIAIEYVE